MLAGHVQLLPDQPAETISDFPVSGNGGLSSVGRVCVQVVAAAASLQVAPSPDELANELGPFHTFRVISFCLMSPEGVYPDSSEITIL